MPVHPLRWVRFESVACHNPLLEASLLVVDPQARFAARSRRGQNNTPRPFCRRGAGGEGKQHPLPALRERGWG